MRGKHCLVGWPRKDASTLRTSARYCDQLSANIWSNIYQHYLGHVGAILCGIQTVPAFGLTITHYRFDHVWTAMLCGVWRSSLLYKTPPTWHNETQQFSKQKKRWIDVGKKLKSTYIQRIQNSRDTFTERNVSRKSSYICYWDFLLSSMYFFQCIFLLACACIVNFWVE